MDGIVLARADITTLEVDAIVNAANQHLAGGGGVDGAIHRAAGPSVMRELRERYNGCPTGHAVITSAGKLRARYIIHAVGPRWRDGEHNEPELLRSAYDAAFGLATEHQCTTVASPSISTGIYGFPVERAAPIALAAARAGLDAGVIQRVTFALFNDETHAAFTAASQ